MGDTLSWGLFLLCAAGLTVGLWVPSLLYLPFTKLSFKQVLAMAPVMTSLMVAVLGTFLHALDLRLEAHAFYGLILVISALSGLFLYRHQNITHQKSKLSSETFKKAFPLLLSVVTGIVVVGYVYYRGLRTPDAFLQVFDNSFHLSVVKSMSESSDFSVLSVGAYLEPGTDAFNPDPSVGFYPACWHMIAAMLVQMTSIPVAAAINVTNFVFIATVLPLGIQALIGEWTKDDVMACSCAAVVTFAFTAFPWSLLYWGPVYPNLAAFCCVPAVAAVLKAGLSGMTVQGGSLKGASLAIAIFGICGLALLQPNSVFTLGIWSIPVLMDCAIAMAERTGFIFRLGKKNSSACLLIRAMVLMFVAVVWVVCYHSSFMSGVVAFTWPSFTHFFEAIRRVVTLCFNEYAVAIPLAVIVVIGCWCCLCNRQYSGLAFCFFFACGLFVVDAINDGTLRHILTGFWYTDQYRVAAMAALFGIPVAALGLSHILGAMRLSAIRLCDSGGDFISATVFAAIVAMGLLYWPENVDLSGEEQLSPIGSVKNIVGYMYSIDDSDNNLTSSEAAFLLEVKAIVGDDLIINNPYDGSCYGYALDGLNLMYRKFGLTGKGESENSVTIRKSLNRIASDSETEQVVESTGAKYVLLLDSSQDGREGVDMPGYNAVDWLGIDSVFDDTEGFELVLSSDDMKLYKICV